MLQLISSTSQTMLRSEIGSTNERPKWPQRLWRMFLDWLLEPIPFPGKCDINVPPPRSYNKVERPTSPPPTELDGG
jgi:hypothetical protein